MDSINEVLSKIDYKVRQLAAKKKETENALLLANKEIKDLENQVMELVKENKTLLVTEPKGTCIYNKDGETYVKDCVTFTDSQLRSIFKNAGAHIYDYSGDVFYIGRNWLCSHTIFGGEKTIYLPFDAKVIDPINGNIKYNSTRIIKFVASPKSTTIFRIVPL